MSWIKHVNKVFGLFKVDKNYGGKILKVSESSSIGWWRLTSPELLQRCESWTRRMLFQSEEKRSLCPSYLSCSALHAPLPSILLPLSSPILYSQLVYKKKNSFVLWPWTELTGQLRFLFGHSVALKDSLADELLLDCFFWGWWWGKEMKLTKADQELVWLWSENIWACINSGDIAWFGLN